MNGRVKRAIINNKGYITFLFVTIIYAITWYIKKDRSIINSDGSVYFQYFSRIFISHNFINSGLIKYPVGTTLMQLPFLVMGYALSVILGIDIAEDISIVELFMYVGAWSYCLLGLTLIYRYIKKYYSKMAAVVTCVCTLFGTMLVLYTTEKASFSHVYGFCACTLFLAFVFKYEDIYDGSKRGRRFRLDICLGMLLGLIALIRNTDIIIGFVYLLYGVDSVKAFGKRIKRLFSAKILVQLIGFLVIYSIQIICWKLQTGDLILYSYGDEKFTYWNNPQILKVLFSDAKGLFIYSPILIVSILGLFMKRKDPINNITKWIIILIQTYIISAWWCWWLGAAYSERMYCDILCLFAIPMGAFFAYLFEYIRNIRGRNISNVFRGALVVTILGVCGVFVVLNLVWIQGCYEYRISANMGTWYMLKMYLKSSIKNILL